MLVVEFCLKIFAVPRSISVFFYSSLQQQFFSIKTVFCLLKLLWGIVCHVLVIFVNKANILNLVRCWYHSPQEGMLVPFVLAGNLEVSKLNPVGFISEKCTPHRSFNKFMCILAWLNTNLLKYDFKSQKFKTRLQATCNYKNFKEDPLWVFLINRPQWKLFSLILCICCWFHLFWPLDTRKVSKNYFKNRDGFIFPHTYAK